MRTMIIKSKNMKRLKLVLIAVSALAFVIPGCRKSATGPVGPTGATGATGPAGPDSTIHSQWIVLSMSISGTYTDSSGNTDTLYTDTLPAPQITQTILDSGVILSYLSYIDTNGVTNVMNASPYFNPELFQVGQIALTSINVDLSTGYSYRYVIIPGTLLATNSILKNYTKAQLKAADYSTIVKALGISDKKTPN